MIAYFLACFAFRIDPSSEFSCYDCSFEDNLSRSGGAIFVIVANLTLSYASFVRNSAVPSRSSTTDGDGGAVTRGDVVEGAGAHG